MRTRRPTAKTQRQGLPPARDGAPRKKQALSNVGGEVECRGDEDAGARLRTAMAVEAGEEASRAHVHGFHSYPARMHPVLARRLIELFAPAQGDVLDPFCGSGTVLVESRLSGRLAVGVDLNPLAVTLARLKVSGASPVQLEQIEALAVAIADHGDQRRKARAGATRRYPDVDALQFEPHVLLELDSIQDGLSHAPAGFARNALWLVLSSILTKVSRKRGDTGEVDAQPRRLAAGFTLRTFLSKATELVDRLDQYTRLLPRQAPEARVQAGDARSLVDLRPESMHAVITSPPYPGNYDYLAHHETRMRWLGLNPSGLAAGEIGARRNLERLGAQAGPAAFKRDMADVLAQAARVLRPGGFALLVIADSVVAGHAVRVDELLAASAKGTGLNWLATASQERSHFHHDMAREFERKPKREHVIALQKD